METEQKIKYLIGELVVQNQVLQAKVAELEAKIKELETKNG